MLEGESAKISSSSLEKQYTSKQEIEDIIQEFFNQEKYQDYAAFVQGILISRIPDKGLFLGGASGKRNITTFLNKCFNNSSWLFPASFSSISIEKQSELFNALKFFYLKNFLSILSICFMCIAYKVRKKNRNCILGLQEI